MTGSLHDLGEVRADGTETFERVVGIDHPPSLPDALGTVSGGMPTDVIARRRARLAVIVAVACGVVALGVTGVGLLLPAGSGAPVVRLVGAVAAVAAGGVLLRLEGPARGSVTVSVVAVTAAAVCLTTLPVSPVSLDLGGTGPQLLDPAPEGEGGGVDDVTIDGAGGPGAGAGGSLSLPPGGDVVVSGDEVILTLPDGIRVTLGDATVDGVGGAIPGEGANVVVVDGVVTRDDGVAIGGDVSLGGVTIERDDGTRVTVGDGRLFDVPEPIVPDEDEPADPTDAVLAMLLGLFALLAFAPPLVRFGERRPVPLLDEPEPVADDDDVPVPVSMEEGLAEVLRSMLADPDPRTSVIGAYARLLTAIAEAGFPRRVEEGPHEHLWRTLGPLGVRRQPVHRLAELFVRARFTPLPVTEADRQSAIGALADAVGDLRLQATDVREAAVAAGVSA